MNKYVYLYNYSFISFLNLVKTLFKMHIIPDNIKNKDYQNNLFDKLIRIQIDENENIIKEVIKKFGINIFNIIYKVFLPNNEYKELIIYYFLINCLKYQDKVLYMRNLKSVNMALKISKYVSRENHKFKGFLRFKELKNNVLYAEIEPENDILFLLSKHFIKRLKNEYWIIRDVKRKIVSIYDKKNNYFLFDDDFKLINIEYSDQELSIQNLWKTFYDTIYIKERTNEKCRMNFMPKKYWKYIIEVSDYCEDNSK